MNTDPTEWIEAYYQQWLYDQDLIDRANHELNEITIKENESHA